MSPGFTELLPRICLVTETYYPVIGGGETQARALTQDLIARGYQVMIATRRSKEEFAREEEIDGAKVNRLWPPGRGQGKKWLLLISSFWFYLSHRRDYDIILVSGYRILGISAVLAARLLGKKCILKADNNGEMSGSYFTSGLAMLKISWALPIVDAVIGLRNLLFRRADSFVALSSEIVAELAGNGVRPSAITVIPNSYDSQRFVPGQTGQRDADRARLGFPVDHTIVMFTGRLIRPKGLPLLVEVWKSLQPHHPQASLVIVGSGDDLLNSCEEEIKAFVRDNGLSASVFFTGGVRDVEKYLQCGDIFVFPTEDEAFGISLIEAMACGLPPVATSIGGIKDIVQPDETGLLVAAKDGASLRAGLQRLLADPEAAARMGAAAAASVHRRYTRDMVVSSYIALFDAIHPRGGSR